MTRIDADFKGKKISENPPNPRHLRSILWFL